jgi:hypothetical protein
VKGIIEREVRPTVAKGRQPRPYPQVENFYLYNKFCITRFFVLTFLSK